MNRNSGFLLMLRVLYMGFTVLMCATIFYITVHTVCLFPSALHKNPTHDTSNIVLEFRARQTDNGSEIRTWNFDKYSV